MVGCQVCVLLGGQEKLNDIQKYTCQKQTEKQTKTQNINKKTKTQNLNQNMK